MSSCRIWFSLLSIVYFTSTLAIALDDLVDPFDQPVGNWDRVYDVFANIAAFDPQNFRDESGQLDVARAQVALYADPVCAELDLATTEKKLRGEYWQISREVNRQQAYTNYLDGQAMEAGLLSLASQVVAGFALGGVLPKVLTAATWEVGFNRTASMILGGGYVVSATIELRSQIQPLFELASFLDAIELPEKQPALLKTSSPQSTTRISVKSLQRTLLGVSAQYRPLMERLEAESAAYLVDHPSIATAGSKRNWKNWVLCGQPVAEAFCHDQAVAERRVRILVSEQIALTAALGKLMLICEAAKEYPEILVK